MSYAPCSCPKLHYNQGTLLYGSKPKKSYKTSEVKWFGGILGGHVGIEVADNKILNFIPYGKFHIIQQKDRHSRFVYHSYDNFYSLFGTSPEEVKKSIVTIPINYRQKRALDSIATAYTKRTPYDYAFIGKRCGSAAYDVLSQLNIVKRYSHRKTLLKIFYPRKLRKRLFRIAKNKNWSIKQENGNPRRKWERD